MIKMDQLMEKVIEEKFKDQNLEIQLVMQMIYLKMNVVEELNLSKKMLFLLISMMKKPV